MQSNIRSKVVNAQRSMQLHTTLQWVPEVLFNTLLYKTQFNVQVIYKLSKHYTPILEALEHNL